MTANAFRRLALSLPEVIEASHMSHPDFRVANKIFATLGPDQVWGMVKLTPEQQQSFVTAQPEMFQPVPGGWGVRGATRVILKAAKSNVVLPALITAWQNVAPARLVEEYEAK